MQAENASELIALRIITQRLFALLASTQPNPNAFVMEQLEAVKADADRYRILVDDPKDERTIRNETKAILTDLFHGMIQKPQSGR